MLNASLVILIIAKFLLVLSYTYKIIIIVSALLVYIPHDKSHNIIKLIINSTEPFYNFMRKRFRTHFGIVDISPFILFLMVHIFEILFINNLMYIALSFKFQ